jgi:hypothetical protein
MTRILCVAGLMAVLTFDSQARAGGPPPTCMVVDKIVLEPNEKAPTAIQVWGTFIFLGNQGVKYGAPQRGYLYYTAVPGKEEQCQREWASLRKLAAQDQIIAFGMCGSPKMEGHLRKADEKPESPIVFPLSDNGFVPGERYVDPAGLKQLLDAPAPLSPADGARLTTGKVTLKARNIRDKEHAKAKYLFEIRSSSGESEESPPIVGGEKHTEWSPNMTVKAGQSYTWRVRASEGTWQGPTTTSSFRVKARS